MSDGDDPTPTPGARARCGHRDLQDEVNEYGKDPGQFKQVSAWEDRTDLLGFLRDRGCEPSKIDNDRMAVSGLWPEAVRSRVIDFIEGEENAGRAFKIRARCDRGPRPSEKARIVSTSPNLTLIGLWPDQNDEDCRDLEKRS